MRCRQLIVSAGVLLAATALGRADDLVPVHKASSAPPRAWRGFYGGPTLGWARGGSSGSYHGITPAPVPTPTPPLPAIPAITNPNDQCGESLNDSLQGAAVYVICALLDPITPGAVAGYDVRLGAVVAGLEADVGWIGRHSPMVRPPTARRAGTSSA